MKTETKLKHTPLPWRVNRALIAKTIYAPGGEIVLKQGSDFYDLRDGDIELIVRAVNAYESLLKENIKLQIDKEKLLEAAQIGLAMAQDLEDTSHSKMTAKYYEDKDSIIAAISKAEGRGS